MATSFADDPTQADVERWLHAAVGATVALPVTIVRRTCRCVRRRTRAVNDRVMAPLRSCDRLYACACGHTRGNFGWSGVLAEQQRAGAFTHFGGGVEDDGGELVDAERTQFVEPVGHRFLVADDGGVLGVRVALPVEHRAI